jgi:hypothetical protein
MTSSDTVTIRPYTCEDRAASQAIFDGNTPEYFAPDERSEFAAFLDLLETTAGEVIGCGGYYVSTSVAVAAAGRLARFVRPHPGPHSQ